VREAAVVTWTSPLPAASAGLVSDGPLTGDDRTVLQGYLAHQRTTLLRICGGLTAAQLAARPVPPSTLSLLGLVRHLTKVERVWLRQRAGGEDVPPLHGGPGDDTDFDAADPARAEQEVAALREEWVQADAAAADVPLDHEIDFRGRPMSLRAVYLHLISEYARHNGHADLLRQAIDGVTGR
jgi:uncharacterized damage-inducible protein DinB